MQVTNVDLQKSGITINIGIVEVDIGVPTTFECNIIPSTSRPPPTVIWYIGTDVKQRSTTSTTYTVTASETDHNKIFYCKAYNLQPERHAVESTKPMLYVRGKVEKIIWTGHERMVLTSFANISLGKRDRSLLCFSCHFGGIWMLSLCISSSRCHGMVCCVSHLLTFTMCHQQLASTDTSA